MEIARWRRALSRLGVSGLNIGDRNDRGFHPLTEQEAHDLVDAPDVVCHSLKRSINRKAMTARQWRGLAQDVDALVKEARAGITVNTPVRLLIMGQAPLPVFAYLGHPTLPRAIAEMRGMANTSAGPVPRDRWRGACGQHSPRTDHPSIAGLSARIRFTLSS